MNFRKKGGLEITIQDEAELFMAMRNYSCEGREKWDEGIDIIALDSVSKEKVLLRIVETKSKSGFVGIDAVRKMLEAIEHENYDKVFLFGKRFTDAAKQELVHNDIPIRNVSHERQNTLADITVMKSMGYNPKHLKPIL